MSRELPKFTVNSNKSLFSLFPATLPKSSSFSRSGPGAQLNAKLQKAQSFDVARWGWAREGQPGGVWVPRLGKTPSLHQSGCLKQ